MPYRILWMDVEVPGSYGWGSNGSANRQVLNGFWDYVTNTKRESRRVYSTNYQWGVIMSGNTGIPNTWEWTAQVSRANSPSPCPVCVLLPADTDAVTGIAAGLIDIGGMARAARPQRQYSASASGPKYSAVIGKTKFITPIG